MMKQGRTMNRKHLPTTRKGITHKLTIHSTEGKVRIYFTVGLFEDGQPGELFIKVDKDGQALDGSLKSWALAISMLLQSGWDVESLHNKFSCISHEPSGITEGDKIHFAKSPEDYIINWMKKEFCKDDNNM